MGNATELLAKLAEPFEPKHITWKPGSATKDGGKCMAMAYADLRAYQERLDEVCGLDWSIEYQPWGDTRVIARLTIGGVTRSSTGEMGSQDIKNEMGGTVAEAQAMKRAAAQFGLGRYLYDLPNAWVEFDAQRKRITDAGQRELDSKYAAWYAKHAPKQEQKPDNPFDESPTKPVLSEAQYKQLHALGKQYYGAEWDEQRPKLVQAVSKGAVTSSKELTPDEAHVLITGLQKRVNEQHAKQAQPVAA